MSDETPSDAAQADQTTDVELSEEHVGKPLLSPETYVVGMVTGVTEHAYTAEQEPGVELDFLSVGLLSSGDGKLAVMPDQIHHIDDDGVYLK